MMRIAPNAIWILALLTTAGAAWALDPGDRYAIDEAAQDSLEYSRTNESSRWINPDTGSEGTFTPVATHESEDGRVCREYTITAIIGGKEEQVYGTACRQPDGSWVEANSAPYPGESAAPPAYPSAPAPPPDVVYSPTTVVYPWWGWLSSFAFSGSYCSDGLCLGGRYGYGYPYGAYYPYGYRYPYGYPYAYGYYPYRLSFNYSYYDYDDRYYHRGRHHYKPYRHHGRHHYRSYRHHDQHRYRSHRSSGDRHYRYSGHDRYDRRSKHHYRGHDRYDRRSKHHYRGHGGRDHRDKSAHPRRGRSHDRPSKGFRSRGGRSGKVKLARGSRDR